MENLFPMPQGGATFTPGTHFAAEVSDSTRKTRLIRFAPSLSKRFVLEFGHTTLRFYLDHALVETGGSAYQISTVFTEDDLFGLKFRRIGTDLYIVSPNHPPQILTYTSDTSWAILAMTFEASSEVFTSAGNYPRAIGFKDDRLYFAKGQSIYASAVGNYDNFILGTNDNEAFGFTIASNDENEILWIEEHTDLVIGTAGGEFIMTGGGAPLTPTNVFVRRETNYGSVDLQGLLVGDSLVFVQRSGRKVREYYYPQANAPYQGPDLTFFADHIGESAFVDMDHAREPYPTTWFIRADGVLVGMTRDRIMQTLGWHRQATAGHYESVCVIPGVEQDELWVVVRREVGGTTRRYVEYFESFDLKPVADSFFVHSGKTIDGGPSVGIDDIQVGANNRVYVTNNSGFSFGTGNFIKISGVEGMTELNWNVYRVEETPTAQEIVLGFSDASGYVDGSGFSAYAGGGSVQKVHATVSGLSHLEGLLVAVLADGGLHAPKTVIGGAVSLDRWANKITVGLGYSGKLRTMPIVAAGKKRVYEVYLRFLDSIGCKVGSEEGSLEELIWMDYGESVLGPAALFSGEKEHTISAKVDRDGYVTIVHDYPLPFTIISLQTDLELFREAS